MFPSFHHNGCFVLFAGFVSTFRRNVSRLSFILILLLNSACSYKEPKKQSVLIAGSESERHLAEFNVKQYAKNGNKNIDFSIDGGGSEEGLRLLKEGRIDIANSSRHVSPKELEIPGSSQKIYPVMVALDVLLVICHTGVDVDSLSMSQLSDIFGGKIQNWKTITGKDLPIKLITRNKNSGTYHYFRDRLFLDSYASATTQAENNDELIEVVKQIPGSIGYVNMGSLKGVSDMVNKSVRVINISTEGIPATSPFDKFAIKSGHYPLTRPLFQYVRSDIAEYAKDFIKFELSEETQSKLEELGYFPLSSIHTHINRKKLASFIVY